MYLFKYDFKKSLKNQKMGLFIELVCILCS